MKELLKIIVLIMLLTTIGGANGTNFLFAQNDNKSTISLEQHQRDMDVLQKKRDSTLAVISEFNISELFNQMNKDSRTREHFNSPVYREMVHNRKRESNELFEMINKQQKVGYISLMALRKMDIKLYTKTETGIKLNALAESFRQTKVYNRWGIPHLYWQAPAKSFIELGEASEKILKSFLKDKSVVMMMGHEEELEIERYKYRKCDYALAMIMEIRGQRVKEIPQKTTDRDKMIVKILEE